MIEQLKADLLQARKNKDLDKANILRLVLSEYEAEQSRPNAKDLQAVIEKMVKNLKEIFKAPVSAAVIANTEYEIKVLEEYLPPVMTELEVEKNLSEWKLGEPRPNIGGAMKYIKQYAKDYGYRLDGVVASNIAKKVLLNL